MYSPTRFTPNNSTVTFVRAVRDAIQAQWPNLNPGVAFREAIILRNQLREQFKPKKGLDLREGSNYTHYVNRETNNGLCGRPGYALWRNAEKAYVDCPGCVIAVQRKFAEESDSE